MILFRYTWRAYDGNRAGSVHPMIGERGVSVDRLAPSGYIRIGGELWRAKTQEEGLPIEKGVSVRVKGAQGLTLWVEADREEIGESGRRLIE